MKYEIWQLKDEKAWESYGFESYKWAEKHGFSFDHYEKTYEGIENGWHFEKDLLEHLFTKFNANRPEDFKGHSLSVSDIVVLDGKKFYCNPFGWQEI